MLNMQPKLYNYFYCHDHSFWNAFWKSGDSVVHASDDDYDGYIYVERVTFCS